MSGSIRRQLVSSFVLFALVLGALFAIVTLLVFHRVEDRMTERRLEQMLSAPATTPGPLTYVGPSAGAPRPFPQLLENLEPGFYEFERDHRETHVLLVADSATGEQTVAVASFPESEVSQDRLAIALAIGVAASSLLALLLARTLAVRIVSPIERLTERLATGALDAVVPKDLAGELRDDEVGTLARALQRAGDDLTAASERERQFLREASHELRTPITVIQGVSDLLHESVGAEDTVTRQRLERLDRGLRRMSTSVSSLLAMARAEHRLTVTEMPPFDEQLEDLLDEARSLAAPGVEVKASVSGAPVSGFAASMLILVISNLVRNAVQHTAHGTVQILVEPGRATVSDSGPGLEAKLLDQLRSTGPQPDVGIGLATVQRICKRFNWGFAIECPADGGTLASVELTAD